jgi:hypothetical protein
MWANSHHQLLFFVECERRSFTFIITRINPDYDKQQRKKKVICTQMYQSYFEFNLFSLVTSQYSEICGYALYLYLHLIRETTPICSFPFMPLFQFVKIKVFKCVVYIIPLFTQRPASAGITSELGFRLCISKLYFDSGGCWSSRECYGLKFYIFSERPLLNYSCYMEPVFNLRCICLKWRVVLRYTVNFYTPGCNYWCFVWFKCWLWVNRYI